MTLLEKFTKLKTKHPPDDGCSGSSRNAEMASRKAANENMGVIDVKNEKVNLVLHDVTMEKRDALITAIGNLYNTHRHECEKMGKINNDVNPLYPEFTEEEEYRYQSLQMEMGILRKLLDEIKSQWDEQQY